MIDWVLFGQQTIQTLIASLPQLLVVFTTLRSFKKETGNVVNDFPIKLNKVKENLTDNFNSFKDDLDTMIHNEINELAQRIEKPIIDVLEKAEKMVDNFEKLYQENVKLVKENKTYQEIVLILASKDKDFIKNGISSYIADTLSLSKEELSKLPSDIIAYLPEFKKEISEIIKLIGKEAFDKILKESGYER